MAQAARRSSGAWTHCLGCEGAQGERSIVQAAEPSASDKMELTVPSKTKQFAG